VASIVLLFAFVRRITTRTLPAILAAVLLVHSAERGVVFGIVGNYPSTLLYLAVPALLYLVWACTEGKNIWRRLFAGQALLVGAMFAAHLPNAILMLPPILAFEVTRIAQTVSTPREGVNASGAVVGSLAAAVALVAFAIVPALLDIDRVSLSLDSGALAVGGVRLEPLLIVAGIAPATFEHIFVRDHGTFWMALGIVAGLASLGRTHRKWLPLFAGLCTTLALIALVDDRAAIGLPFFLYPLCAVAFDAASRRAEAFGLRGSGFLIPVAGVAMAIAFAVEVPPPSYASASDFDVYENIPESDTRSRTFDITRTTISLDGFYGQSSFSPYLSGRAIPFGAYPQGASPATQVRLALMSMLVEELSAMPPAISDDALDLLYLDHVEFLVVRGRLPVAWRLLLAGGAGEQPVPGLLKLRHASPALFAPELAALPDWVQEAGARDRSPRLLGVLEQIWQEDQLDWVRTRSLDPLFRIRKKQDWEVFLPLLRAMELDRARAQATRIFVDEPPTRTDRPSGPPAEFAILSHLEEPTRASIVARASQPGYVRLSYAHDPDLAISLDDERVATTADALGGAIAMAFPAGTHTIEVRAPAEPLQTRLLWLSFFLVLMLTAVLVSREPRRVRST
jgi:hypothetical protein